MGKLVRSLVIILLLAIFFSGITPYFFLSAASGASFNISPANGSFKAGDTFSASVNMNAGGSSVNSAEAVLNFPVDLLEVVSFSRFDSIFSLWTQEPTVLNNGTIIFGGGTPSSFSGNNGNLFDLIFRAKKGGSASLVFSGEKILAADGKGTNVFVRSEGAAWDLFVQPAPLGGTPLRPQVFSLTHSNSNNWYSRQNLELEWILPQGVSGVSFSLGHDPLEDPGTISNGLFASRAFQNLDEGIWYFNLRFKNTQGWGDVSHFRFQIDVTPPEPFFIQFLNGRETTNKFHVLNFDTTDLLSGIDRYEIQIGDGDQFNAEILAAGTSYLLPDQAFGEHSIVVQVFDKAGNMQEARDVFFILASGEARTLEFYFFKVALPTALFIVMVGFIYINFRFISLKRHKNIR